MPGALPAQHRVAWLLRANRLLGGGGVWVRTATFATAFPGGWYPASASESKVSRWETGVVRAPYAALRRYEELLELPAHQLVSAADVVYRFAGAPDHGPPTLRRPFGEEGPDGLRRLEELVDMVTSVSVVAARQWDELTARLSAQPRLLLVPRSTWSQLAERLVAEVIISDGTAWQQRYEALNRLLNHPVGGPAAVAACASLAADPTNQVFIETVSALDATGHPDASRHVLGQLAAPTNQRAQLGALFAAVRKIRHGHFTPAQLDAMLPIIRELLDEPDLAEQAHPVAVGLIRQIPAGRRGPAYAEFVRRVRVISPAAPCRATRPGSDGSMLARIAEAVVATVRDRPPGFEDDTLPALIEEMLCHEVSDARLYASMLLAATPYRKPVATALADELARSCVVAGAGAARPLLDALRVLGGGAERRLVERLVVTPGLPEPVVLAAAQNIGHVGGRSDDAYWWEALRHHSTGWRRDRDPASAAVLTGLVYAVGIARNANLLTEVRADPAMPDPARSAATWWSNLPDSILESARQ